MGRARSPMARQDVNIAALPCRQVIPFKQLVQVFKLVVTTTTVSRNATFSAPRDASAMDADARGWIRNGAPEGKAGAARVPIWPPWRSDDVSRLPTSQRCRLKVGSR